MLARPIDQMRVPIPRLVCTILMAGALGGAIGSTPAEGGVPDSPAHRLAHWLSGTFTSRAQAAADSAFYEVELRTTPIWEDRSDGPWLYVEQTMASHRDRPYRQRVYHLTPSEAGTVRSAVYTLPDAARFIGGWRSPDLFGGLTPDSLSLRAGCGIQLTFAGDAFEGSTQGSECASSLRGASYATSEVRIEATRITSWDRGFDEDGEQMWGAVTGPYRFDRVPGPTPLIEN